MTTYVTPYQITRTVECPNCLHSHIQVNQMPASVRELYCVDCELCGTRWSVKMHKDEAELTQEPNTHAEYGYALLQYSGGGKPHFVVVEHRLWLDNRHAKPRERAIEHADYLYKEHVCPADFLGVLELSLDGRLDPHGIYEFVTYRSKAEVKATHGLTWEELADLENDDGAPIHWPDVFPQLTPQLSQR